MNKIRDVDIGHGVGGNSKRTVEELRALSSWLMEAQESERQYIAQELHAEIAQYLAMLKLFLDKAAHDVSREKYLSSLCEAQLTIKDLLRRVLDLSFSLYPNMLDLGLLPALLWYFERYTAQTRTQVDFKHDGLNGTPLDQIISTIGYRVVQERLTSLAHQAGISKITVHVRVSQEKLHIKIEDNGGSHPSDSIAFVSLRERALLVGGKLKVHFVPGVRTAITAKLPLTVEKDSPFLAPDSSSFSPSPTPRGGQR